MMQTVRDILNRMRNQKKSHEVMPTGFNKLDSENLDGGFYAGELVVVGAHTGVGKSQLAIQILLNIAEQGFKTAYFSLEISNEMILARMVGMKTNIKPSMVRFGNLEKQEFESKQNAEMELVGLGDRMSFYDQTYLLDEIMGEIKKHKYEFVVVDFVQNIMDKVNDEYSRLSKIAVTLQKLAKETNCTILILSQLSNTAARDGSRSKTLEYKGSGAIAMVADLGFFLEKDDDDNTILTLKKNRRGFYGRPLNVGFKLPGGMLYEK